MSAQPQEELAAFAALTAGDPRGLGYYFDRYYSSLVYHATAYVNHETVAQDIVSETFQRLWERRTTLRLKSVKALLYCMVQNRAIDYLRAQKKEEAKQQSFSYRAEAQEPSILHRLIETETYAELHQEMAKLPKSYREVIVLSIWKGKSTREIARLLNLPEGSVKSKKFRGLRLLKTLYEQTSRSSS